MYEAIEMLPSCFYSGKEIRDMLKCGYIYRSVWYRKKSDAEIKVEETIAMYEARDAEYDAVLSGIL